MGDNDKPFGRLAAEHKKIIMLHFFADLQFQNSHTETISSLLLSFPYMPNQWENEFHLGAEMNFFLSR